MILLMYTTNHTIIFFDGECNLCNKAVQFVIKRDKKQNFRFASLQSNLGKKILQQYNLVHKSVDSIMVLKGGTIFTESTAILKIVRQLDGAWKTLYCFSIVPRSIRNAIYRYIAKNRYKWFGKTACMVPSDSVNALFYE